ncbi:type VI secretion system lipoprotein TssJ [Teredinibacter sp. KSP-S5-2]|uniref:type VI secretion system lipoprotein TssJ n=1 Tax=Teredinibacter sp. KSP-S5-2 TaxID=3034506 RepID=UPI002934AF09|nr:type VI secretion system lipoprotein TssJ [Teredinibacter sp. KSP-S5-2]WNO08067.1 type VI secretion system lipoprotein TssJ [Teredinibacter sp. KSP-S5-2]
MFKYKLAWIFSAVVLVGLSGCETVNSGVGGVLNLDTNLKLNLIVDSDINPDEQNRPSPLFIRLYQLKSTKMFNKSDFIDLYERDEEILGADFVSKQELKRLVPGQSRIEKFVLEEDTQYIALFAQFFKYKDANYKLVFPVTSNNVIRDSVKVRITSNDIKLIEK